MTKARRRRPKPGSYLTPVEATVGITQVSRDKLEPADYAKDYAGTSASREARRPWPDAHRRGSFRRTPKQCGAAARAVRVFQVFNILLFLFLFLRP